jgi:hypothetical protein
MLPAMAVIGFAWLLGDLATVNSVTQLAIVALLVCAVVALLGFRVARVIAFPLAFLFFAVPIGEFMLPQLMSGQPTSPSGASVRAAFRSSARATRS